MAALVVEVAGVADVTPAGDPSGFELWVEGGTGVVGGMGEEDVDACPCGT